MVIITVRHRPFPVQLAYVANRFSISAEKRADRKRATSGCSTSTTKQTKQQVTVAICEKWQREFNHDYQMLLWLRYDAHKTDRSLVDTLWCLPDLQREDPIYEELRGRMGVGVDKPTSSNILDHSKGEQHAACMAHMRANSTRAQHRLVESFTPIARALLVLDDWEKERMKQKFEICYILAREGIAFLKYASFHALVEHQGVEIGSSDWRRP